MKVLILHNKISDDSGAEIDTLTQVKDISASLHRIGYEYFIAELDDELSSIDGYIESYTPDVVFNLVERYKNSDANSYLVAEYLEKIAVKITGCNSNALSTTSDKRMVKNIVADIYPNNVPHGYDQGNTKYIVKSATEHASFGIDESSIVSSFNAANKLIEANTKLYGGAWMAEQFVEGREINVSLMEINGVFKVIAIAEIEFINFEENMPKIVGSKAKWDEDSFEYQNTIRRFISKEIEPKLYKDLSNMSLDLAAKLNLTSYARADYRVDANGKIYLLEINCNPCLSRDAGFVAAALEYGMDYDNMIQNIISNLFISKVENAERLCDRL